MKNWVLPDGLRMHCEHRRVIDNCDEGPYVLTKEIRVAIRAGAMGMTVSPRGGETYVALVDGHDRIVVEGFARCSPKDNYVRKIGRAIALGRALAKYWVLGTDLVIDESHALNTKEAKKIFQGIAQPKGTITIISTAGVSPEDLGTPLADESRSGARHG